jgi:hypothetical protein
MWSNKNIRIIKFPPRVVCKEVLVRRLDFPAILSTFSGVFWVYLTLLSLWLTCLQRLERLMSPNGFSGRKHTQIGVHFFLPEKLELPQLSLRKKILCHRASP